MHITDHSVKDSAAKGRTVEDLYSKHREQCRALLKQWRTPEFMVEDIIQDTFVSIFTDLEKFKNPKSVIRTILERRRADAIRRWAYNPDLNRLHRERSAIRKELKLAREEIPERPEGNISTIAISANKIKELQERETDVLQKILELEDKIIKGREEFAKITKDSSDDPDQVSDKDASKRPDQILEDKESQEYVDKIIEKTVMKFKSQLDKTVAKRILEEQLDGDMKLIEIAEKFEIDVKEVYRIWHRVQRDIKKKFPKPLRKRYEMHK